MALALHRLSVRGVGRLPVVAREDPTRLLGAVRRSDIVRAYNIALTRRAEVQHRAAHMRLRRVDRAEFVEVVVGMDAPCVNCTVQYLAKRFPHESVLVSIRRANGQVIIPHGDTIFLPGDRVTVFVETEAEEKVRQLLAGYGAT
jgi:CIC family chloride channel protein